MLERLLQNDSVFAAQGALDGLAARHAATADNIANVNTPGYQRKVVPFESALARAVSDQQCLPPECRTLKPFKPNTTRDTESIGRTDRNNVDVEREVVQIAETSLRYETLAQYIGSFYTSLKSVINGAK